MDIKKLKISPASVVSLVLMILGIVNLVLQALGKPSIESGTQEIAVFVTAAYALIAGIYSAWKNCNVTKPAKVCQVILDGVKTGAVNLVDVIDAYEALVKSKNNAASDASAIKQETTQDKEAEG